MPAHTPTLSPPPSPSPPSSPLPDPRAGAHALPSANPLPLSATQEAQVRDLYYQRVRRYCPAEIKAFADCALGRTFTVSWACRRENQRMNECLVRHATPDEYDAAREQWFAQRLDRLRQRQQKTYKQREQEDFLRAWWGLPASERAKREAQDALLDPSTERMATVERQAKGRGVADSSEKTIAEKSQ